MSYYSWIVTISYLNDTGLCILNIMSVSFVPIAYHAVFIPG